MGVDQWGTGGGTRVIVWAQCNNAAHVFSFLYLVRHLSRIRAHPKFYLRLYVYNKRTHCLGTLLIRTVGTNLVILCIIKHLQHFSDDEMYAN